MDVERAVLKAGVTVASMFAIYQWRARDARVCQAALRENPPRNPSAANGAGEERGIEGDYIEFLRLKEAKRRRPKVSEVDPINRNQKRTP
ncbi:hypothetical protein [Stutzerimonas azotifigens]|uniref:hypothetical protein n=1 Tax=Stutzerimonas azotifigens TaxID=291995 RepID=UPI0012687161|nr:hypothetical protein [Stutzerimonas azotifigens]